MRRLVPTTGDGARGGAGIGACPVHYVLIRGSWSTSPPGSAHRGACRSIGAGAYQGCTRAHRGHPGGASRRESALTLTLNQLPCFSFNNPNP